MSSKQTDVEVELGAQANADLAVDARGQVAASATDQRAVVADVLDGPNHPDRPASLVFLRTSIGALLLLPVVLKSSRLRTLLPRWRPILLFTFFEVALPWWLLSDAELSGAAVSAAGRSEPPSSRPCRRTG